MTDKLTPSQLRDLADIIDAIPSGEYGAPHFREEAARREAEQLDPVGTASLAASLAQSKDKPAPAADDTPKQCDGKEQEAFEAWAKSQHMDMTEHPLYYLLLDKRTGGARDGWNAALNYCRPFFEAQAREIAALEDSRKIAQDTCDMQTERADRAEAESARLREALEPFAEAARKAEASGKPPFQFCSADDYTRAALARGGEHG